MQDKTIQNLRQFYSSHNRLPSYQELANLYDYQSKESAYKLAKRFQDAGYIRKDAQGKLVPTDKLTGIQVLDDVTAGFPSSLAEEEPVDAMSLDEFLVENREATYVLKADNDSMINAGIQDGDLVLAERTDTANVGDIIIADVDGGFTMKYLRKDNDQYYLRAANDNYEDVYPESGLKVAGIVKGVVRKYN